MRVALGTLEIEEEDRKKIGKEIQGNSYLKRDQARDWALGLIEAEIARIREGKPVADDDDDDNDEAETKPVDTTAPGTVDEPQSVDGADTSKGPKGENVGSNGGPPAADALPEPSPPSAPASTVPAAPVGVI